MERDFLGLNCQGSGNLVKEKTKDILNNSVTEVQWSLAKNKKFSLPYFMPFKAAQEEKKRKILYNSLTSSVFSPVSTGCTFDCNSKSPPCLAKLSDSPSGGSKNHFQGGTIDLRSRNKPSGALAQLTIFYADDVHVSDNISPEKAEAIMCFAGNGSSMRANTKKSSKSIGDDYRNQAQPHQIFISRQSSGATFVERAMPQAQRASLARFLEMRKDRLKNAMPYSLIEKFVDGTNPQFSNISSFAQQGAVAVSGSDVGGTA